MSDLRTTLTPIGREIFDLTLDLVKITSVSRTRGERRIAEHIHTCLGKWSYFKQHPQRLLTCPVGDTGQRNVLALVRGEKSPSDRALLYLGHMDTVDIKEYKDLEDLACDPRSLEKALAQLDLPSDVAQDLKSGQWLFGRGTADMKTGVALLISLVKELAQAPHTFSGNIVLAIVCDEEADSQGMLTLARPLAKLVKRENLDLVGAINTDVVSQLDGGAPAKRHIYLGALGKIVMGAFVAGKGAHVGESLQGFDVNQFLSRFTWHIDGNMELADHYKENVTHPPVSLKQADLKTDYNGQVPFEGYAYYNVLNFKRGASKVLEEFRVLARQSFEECIGRLKKAATIFFERNKKSPIPLDLDYRLMDFSQLCEYVRVHQGQDALDRAMDSVCRTMGSYPELRQHSLALVRAVWKCSGLAGPAAILFIMPPYYPANDPDFDHPKFHWFNDAARAALTPFTEPSQNLAYDISLERFFPFLSDASFCAFTEGDENRSALEMNMPCWGRGWTIDLDRVQELNLPVLDMGVHGKDFHSRFERVHVPYSMETLPRMIRSVTRDLLIREL